MPRAIFARNDSNRCVIARELLESPLYYGQRETQPVVVPHKSVHEGRTLTK